MFIMYEYMTVLLLKTFRMRNAMQIEETTHKKNYWLAVKNDYEDHIFVTCHIWNVGIQQREIKDYFERPKCIINKYIEIDCHFS